MRRNIWKYKTGKNNSSKDEIAFQHPAIFPEDLAKDHILTWSNQNDLILDPFVGSGTTLVEASLAGHTSYGIDVDPLARLISKVKTTPIEKNKLDKSVSSIIEELNKNINSSFRPNIESLNHWFSERASNDLGYIRELIDDWKNEDKDIYDFLVVTFSSIIRQVSNADNQSLKTYVSGTNKKVPAYAKPLFQKRLIQYAERITQYSDIVSKRISANVVNIQDSRDLSKKWLELNLPRVDLVITSPPYIKSVDYIYNQMAEYFWIGDLFGLENQKKQNLFKKKYIGTEKVYSNEYKTYKSSNIVGISDLVKKIRLENEKNAYIVDKYFQDMQEHFLEIAKIMKPQSHYVLVIGDSSVADFEIKTHEILIEIAQNSGFSVQELFAYEIRNRYMRFPRKGRGGIVKLDRIIDLKLD